MGNNRGKKNSHLIISGGGNGIAGLVVFVGALAVAGFVAAASSFAINKNRTKGASTGPNPKPKPKQVSSDNGCKKKQNDREIETSQGLGALRQPSTTNEGDAACHGTIDVNSTNHTSITEEKTDPVPDLNTISEVVHPTRFHHQEIVFSDDSHPESAASSHGSGIEEECLASLINSHGSQAQDVEVEPQESLQSIETETLDDDVVSEEDSSSKAILNTNEKPVFSPAQQDFEGEKIDIQKEAHGAAKTDTGAANGAVTVTPEATSNEKGNFSVVLNDEPSASHSFQLTTWLMPVLLLALLFYFCLSIVHQFFSAIIP